MDDLSQIPDLFHPDILAYAKDPARWRKEHHAQHVIKAYNPLCGDKFEIRIDFTNQVIADISFYGYGCVLSKASTAVLTEMLIGKNADEVTRLVENFRQVISDPHKDLPDPRLLPFLKVREYPARIQCVLLGWDAVMANARKFD